MDLIRAKIANCVNLTRSSKYPFYQYASSTWEITTQLKQEVCQIATLDQPKKFVPEDDFRIQQHWDKFYSNILLYLFRPSFEKILVLELE